MSYLRKRSVLLCGALIIALASRVGAQEAADVSASDSAPPREQTVYVPYEKLRQTFEKEGRGVFIPYERFQELWKAARANERKPTDKPPSPAVIAEADNELTVGKEVARVTARIKIELLASGWIEVPLRLSDAGVISATLVREDGAQEPARLAVNSDGGYTLIVENQAKTPRKIELRLEYAKAFTKTPGRNDVSFAAPQAPVNRWKVRIPEKGVKAHIEPMIAASEAPAERGQSAPDETVLLAFVGAAESVKIDWTAKTEGASGLAALVSVEARQSVRVDEGAVRTRAHLGFAISRAELTQLTLEVPADQKVVNVSAPNVRGWSVEAAGQAQKVVVQLFEPARETEAIDVELEQYAEAAKAEAAARRSIHVPTIKALDVARQQGTIVVDAAEGLQVEARSREGLTQLDPSELSAADGARHDLAYRYAALPFTLGLDVVQVKPRVSVDEMITVAIEPEQLRIALRAAYTIERAGLFELVLDIPAGFDLAEVRGESVGGCEPAHVEMHHLTGADKTRLVVNLAQKAQGRVGLLVALEKRIDDPNLLGPTGKTSELALPLPRVADDSVERATGRVVVFAPESLRVNPGKQAGLRAASPTEALAGMDPSVVAPNPGGRLVSSFLFGKTPVELSLVVERRKPYVSVGQLLSVRVEPGVIKNEATFYYEIRYSGVKNLRIDVPTDLAASIRNTTSGVTEKPLDPQPADTPQGYVAWNLAGDGEFLGTTTIRLTWEQRLENLEVGHGVPLVIPRLRPSGVDRAWGQIALAKSETIDVEPTGTPSGLRPIDPAHDLMPGASAPDAALAFEFHDDWSLETKITQYQLEKVKRTSIERGLVRALFTRSGRLSVQALYRMRSALQRLPVKLPSGVEFDTEPLRINGQPVSLERGGNDEFLVPLVGHGDNEPFLLELRYTLPGASRAVELPAFLDEPAVQQVFISAFLPQELDLVGYQGPWTQERRSDATLVSWVREGIPAASNLADTFQVDGESHVFSTLRPDNGPGGRLRLNSFNSQALQGIVFAAIVAVGLLLLRQPFCHRLAALALLVIGLLLVGVYLPTFATRLLQGGLWLAMALTALVWVGAYAIGVGRRVASRPALAPAATSPEATPPDAATGGSSEGGSQNG